MLKKESPQTSATVIVASVDTPAKSSYSLRPRKVVVTVTHTVSPYNLRPRVKKA